MYDAAAHLIVHARPFQAADHPRFARMTLRRSYCLRLKGRSRFAGQDKNSAFLLQASLSRQALFLSCRERQL